MGVKQSRLRRNDNVMIRIDNMETSDTDALEPYRAISHVSKNPKILYEQSNYTNEEIKEQKRTGVLTIVVYTVSIVVVIAAVIAIVVNLF